MLCHSRTYIIAKTARALHSKYEREDDDIGQELADSKTSAFFAYAAIKRNSLALLAFNRFLKIIDINDLELRQTFFEIAEISDELAEYLKKEFFPQDKLNYIELGCEDYDRTFLTTIQDSNQIKKLPN